MLLADDHAPTITMLRTLLEPEFEIVGTVADGAGLVEAAERLQPDVIVTDITLKGLSGIAAASAIIRRHPSSRIVFVTVDADRTILRRCLATGALGYVLKIKAGEEIVAAVHAAVRGDLHISPFPSARASDPII